MFGGAVGHFIEEATHTGAAGNRHTMSTTLGHHLIPGRLDRVVDACHGDADDLAPQFRRCLGEGDQRHDGGVADHRVEPSPAVHDLGDDLLHRRKVGDIGHQRQYLAARRFDLGDGLLQFLGVDICHADLGTGLCHAHCDPCAEAAAGTGDKNGFIVKQKSGHRDPSG